MPPLNELAPDAAGARDAGCRILRRCDNTGHLPNIVGDLRCQSAVRLRRRFFGRTPPIEPLILSFTKAKSRRCRYYVCSYAQHRG